MVRLRDALDAEGVASPIRTSRTGKRTGGASISRGHLYWILSNPIYIGRLRHKGRVYDGLHSEIVDQGTWDQVQQRLAAQTQPRRAPASDGHSFLAGKLYDDRGNLMGAEPRGQGLTTVAILRLPRRSDGSRPRCGFDRTRFRAGGRGDCDPSRHGASGEA